MNVIEPGEGPPPRRMGVVVSTYNATITDALYEGALNALERAGVSEVMVVRVPGALELAVGAQALIEAGCEGVVALGAVIQGETDHYRIVVDESARGLTEVALRSGRPVANSVLAVRQFEHALERSGPGPANRGAEAADAAVATARQLVAIRESRDSEASVGR